jgi:hypothetical protein
MRELVYGRQARVRMNDPMLDGWPQQRERLAVVKSAQASHQPQLEGPAYDGCGLQ